MSERIDRRSAFLLIAAGVADGLPTPKSTHLYEYPDGVGIVSLDVAGTVEGRRWLEWFGIPANEIRVQAPHEEEDGRTLVRLDWPRLHEWRGWGLAFSGANDVVDPGTPVQGEAADKVRAAAAEITAAEVAAAVLES